MFFDNIFLLIIIAKKVNIFIELITIFFDSSINLVALEIFLYKNYNSIHLRNDKFFLQTGKFFSLIQLIRVRKKKFRFCFFIKYRTFFIYLFISIHHISILKLFSLDLSQNRSTTTPKRWRDPEIQLPALHAPHTYQILYPSQEEILPSVRIKAALTETYANSRSL